MQSLQRAALLIVLLAMASRQTGASKVLVFTMTGMRSHHMNLLKVATELHKRGHSVSALVSSYDEVAQTVIATRGFPELDVVVFDGPPGLGTETWAARLATDPLEVRRVTAPSLRTFKLYAI